MSKIILCICIGMTTLFSTPKVVVTYFMQSFRCESCHYLENQTKETIATRFAKEIKAGTIEFRMVRVDEPKNEYYIKQYKLENKSVVVSKMNGSKVVSWKRLDTLWDYINKDELFSSVVETAVREALK